MISSKFCHLRRLVFDQSSPVHPVLESRGGTVSVTEDGRRRRRSTEILVSNIGCCPTWEEYVHELAVGGPGAHLLDLPDLRLQAPVDPGQHVVSAGDRVRLIGSAASVYQGSVDTSSYPCYTSCVWFLLTLLQLLLLQLLHFIVDGCCRY